MASREEVKRFLSKINPFVEKIPEITAKLSELENNDEFKKALENLGTVGGLCSIRVCLFNEALKNLSDDEKTYYSLINMTAISSVKEILKGGLKADDEKITQILKKMMNIYLYKETKKEKYQKWDGLVSYDHPIVKEFKHEVFQIIKENKIESQYPNFMTEFNLVFKDKIQTKNGFTNYQKQKVIKVLSESSNLKTCMTSYNCMHIKKISCIIICK
jgi:hypothetical protein